MYEIKNGIEDLVAYGENILGLPELDAVYARNQLMALFETDNVGQQITGEDPDLQTEILDPMLSYAKDNGMYEDDDLIRFETKLMGLVTPSPSFVAEMFRLLYDEVSPQEATAYLDDLSHDNNYIRMRDVSKNLKWSAEDPRGDVTVTVNLSKPEKTAEQVAREKLIPNQPYPKCMLCLENVGYNGSVKRPARQTLRVAPIQLGGEEWYMQMSPYVYYDNHVIAFNKNHVPMAVSDMTFKRLTDFVSLFPHYFLGSNADLPIVGGSILSHDHYQGGGKVLPMFKQPVRTEIGKFDGVKIGITDWYNSVVNIKGRDQIKVINAASKVLSAWRKYSDPDVGIFAETEGQPHNTITPIAVKNDEEEFELYLILRNNRTDEAHPDGIYHAWREMHHIKKEGIGLIEAMGIFILPGRLQAEMSGVADLLCGKTPYDEVALSDEKNPLAKHKAMIDELLLAKPSNADAAIKEYINRTCRAILDCTAVFKNNAQGQTAFATFLNGVFSK